ncbi:hypothetical protein DERP_014555, partial [Dermatophagoides pteronyssinus]
MATNNIVITDDEGQTIALILDDNDDEIFNSIYQCTKSIIMMMTSGSKCERYSKGKKTCDSNRSQ